MTILFDNISVDAISTAQFEGSGGSAIAFVRGDNFGGGTVTLSIKAPGDSLNRFEPLNNGTFTTDGEVNIEYLPSGTKVKAQFAGSTGASNVFVEVV